MSEYGIDSPDRITWGWTPAQALIMAEAIRRRRSLEAADRMHETFIAAAAAQGSKPHFRQMRAETKRLRREAGVEPETDVEGMIQALGLTDRRTSG